MRERGRNVSYHTFNTRDGADAFVVWLHANRNDVDKGRPRFIQGPYLVAEPIIGDHGSWRVEFHTDNEYVRGVADGFDAAFKDLPCTQPASLVY